jgi:hypothetical protein
MAAWKKTIIHADGQAVEAAAPVVISASRSTDIPAFHSEWLLNRLKAGWCGWVNPFNGRLSHVSFQAVRAFAFFTKNPEPMFSRLDEWDARGLGYYFHITLNDYEREGLEPGVPALDTRLASFKALSARLGPDRVVWRFDPLLITPRTPLEALLEKVVRLGRELQGFTRKLVFSFADIDRYVKVGRNLKAAGIEAREFSADERAAFGKGLAAAGLGLELGVCAEQDDLSAFGIRPAKCLDDDLLRRLYPRDAELMRFLGPAGEGDLFGGAGAAPGKRRLKDPGQRRECHCMMAKDIGHYTTCPHRCVYCYANASPAQALRQFARCRPDSPALL